MSIQDELADLGISTYEKSDYYKESLSDLRKKANREKTAERRLNNRGTKKVLHRRKAKKIASIERMETN